MSKFRFSTCLILLILSPLLTAQGTAFSQNLNSSEKSSVEKELIGQIEGEDIFQFTLKNKSGMQVQVISYGATITNIKAPDKYGEISSVVLGLDSLSHYAGWQNSLMGSTVGRVANRIEQAKFTLDGKQFELTSDIHGGEKGFHNRIWKGKALPDEEQPSVAMSYFSEDGEEGYPGNLQVKVTFSLNSKNELLIDYQASTDKATPLVLTNHTYFNLSGGKDKNILDTQLTVFAEQYLEYGEGGMPTGNILDVKNTPFDFTTAKPIGKEIQQVQDHTNGYDVTFSLANQSGELALAGRAFEPLSGRELEVYTTEPGMVFYSGNWLSEKVTGRNGVPYTKNGAFCLETQHYPNSVNQPSFPNTILRPGEAFHSQTIYKFLVRR